MMNEKHLDTIYLDISKLEKSRGYYYSQFKVRTVHLGQRYRGRQGRQTKPKQINMT
jgi:hypothetical protein